MLLSAFLCLVGVTAAQVPQSYWSGLQWAANKMVGSHERAIVANSLCQCRTMCVAWGPCTAVGVESQPGTGQVTCYITTSAAWRQDLVARTGTNTFFKGAAETSTTTETPTTTTKAPTTTAGPRVFHWSSGGEINALQLADLEQLCANDDRVLGFILDQQDLDYVNANLLPTIGQYGSWLALYGYPTPRWGDSGIILGPSHPLWTNLENRDPTAPCYRLNDAGGGRVKLVRWWCGGHQYQKNVLCMDN